MDKPTDYIFIDTSSFIKNAYFKESGYIHRLFDLSEQGYLTIIMPAITEYEWQKHYEQSSGYNFADIEKKTKQFGFDDTERFKEKYVLQATADYEKLMKDAWKHHMNRANIVRLPLDYPSDKLKDICEKYISGEKPFGAGKKKSEFPDAFALASVVKYAEEKHLDQITVFSQDKDITEFSSGLLKYEEPKSYLEKYNTQIIPQFTDIQQAKADIDTTLLKCYIDTQPVVLVQQLTAEIEEYLKDDSNYAERFNYADIESVDIDKLDLNFNSDTLEILSITEESIDASLLVYIKAIVNVTHFDEESSIWDSEEKEFLFIFDTTSEINLITTCRVNLSYTRPEEIETEDYFDESDIEVVDIDFSDIQDAIDDSAPWHNKLSYKRYDEVKKRIKNQKKLVDMYTPEIVKQIQELKERLNQLSGNKKRK